jgi:methionyl-tRNA formyltransferase
MKVLFMGTPAFAVPVLQAILNSRHEIVGVITAPDKPAGRGRKLMMSAVKTESLTHHLQVFQPENLLDESFLTRCKTLSPDVAVVVAFRKLPDALWKIPTKGTFNLHASLLPQYRGAAPINRAMMNGETTTGLTTFFINENIDTGNIILSQQMNIEEDDTAGILHDKMSKAGAELVLKTLDNIEKGEVLAVSQDEVISRYRLSKLKTAPKIYKADCLIDWHQHPSVIRNQIRGLSPLPGAYSVINDNQGKRISIKILRAEFGFVNTGLAPGEVSFLNNQMQVGTGEGSSLIITELQPESKSVMNAGAFIRGLKELSGWKFQ